MSSSATKAAPTLGQQAATLLQDMLLSDAALTNSDIQSLLSGAVAKGIAANGDPATVIGSFSAIAVTAPLMAPSLIPQLILQGLKTFQALQALLNSYIVSKLTPAA